MNKRKLIGTIIGVVAFAALIAGATYAWLTNNLGVNNGVYNVASKNFIINFTKGNNIANGVPILASATPSTAKNLNVKAGLATGSTSGTLTIYLNISSIDTNLKNNSIKYSYCIGTCQNTDFADHTQSIGSSTGNKIAIISNQPVTSTTQTTYNIYFWLDGDLIGDNQLGKSFSGFISAEAIQTE